MNIDLFEWGLKIAIVIVILFGLCTFMGCIDLNAFNPFIIHVESDMDCAKVNAVSEGIADLGMYQICDKLCGEKEYLSASCSGSKMVCHCSNH